MKRDVVKVFLGKMQLTLEQHCLNCQVATCIQIFFSSKYSASGSLIG